MWGKWNANWSSHLRCLLTNVFSRVVLCGPWRKVRQLCWCCVALLFKTQHTKVENLQRFHQNSSNIIQDFSTDKKEIKIELNWQLKSHWNIVWNTISVGVQMVRFMEQCNRYHFVDPITRWSTNAFESVWKHMKNYFRPFYIGFTLWLF